MDLVHQVIFHAKVGKGGIMTDSKKHIRTRVLPVLHDSKEKCSSIKELKDTETVIL